MGIILHREAASITLTSGIRHDAIGEVGSKVHLSNENVAPGCLGYIGLEGHPSE